MQKDKECQICGDVIYGAGDICKDCNVCPSCGTPNSLLDGEEYDIYICNSCGKQLDKAGDRAILEITHYWAMQMLRIQRKVRRGYYHHA